ncbi:unnamed protein product [Closterium sp. NIES-64]|nr:unnamed protein product [Closterium sp. NIES-64]
MKKTQSQTHRGRHPPFGVVTPVAEELWIIVRAKIVRALRLADDQRAEHVAPVCIDEKRHSKAFLRYLLPMNMAIARDLLTAAETRHGEVRGSVIKLQK